MITFRVKLPKYYWALKEIKTAIIRQKLFCKINFKLKFSLIEMSALKFFHNKFLQKFLIFHILPLSIIKFLLKCFC